MKLDSSVGFQQIYVRNSMNCVHIENEKVCFLSLSFSPSHFQDRSNHQNHQKISLVVS